MKCCVWVIVCLHVPICIICARIVRCCPMVMVTICLTKVTVAQLPKRPKRRQRVFDLSADSKTQHTTPTLIYCFNRLELNFHKSVLSSVFVAKRKSFIQSCVLVNEIKAVSMARRVHNYYDDFYYVTRSE